MAIDKRNAIKNKERVSENKLFFVSIIGGFIGVALGMVIFNHKINKIKFYLIILLSSMLWLTIIYIFQKVVQ
ncbi:uncharacterized membrane protein YsdA (DUF1294 family) [Bacilli bacterium PM5-9]|nr:uncharacterized membrane protein YsdA (DUF1294 family) [Bacilli bacterium PM5-9]